MEGTLQVVFLLALLQVQAAEGMVCVFLLIWLSVHLHVVIREAVAEPKGKQAEIDPRNMQSISYPVANPTERVSVQQYRSLLKSKPFKFYEYKKQNKCKPNKVAVYVSFSLRI